LTSPVAAVVTGGETCPPVRCDSNERPNDGLGDGLADGDGLAEGLAEGEGLGLAFGEPVGLGDALGLGLADGEGLGLGLPKPPLNTPARIVELPLRMVIVEPAVTAGTF
jgi:hypothetical protein